MIIPFPYPVNTILIAILNVFGISLAFWVYWANKKEKVNRGKWYYK